MLTFFFFCGSFFALLDPYPVQIWIHNTAYNTQLENTRAGALSVSNLEFEGEAL
jgi:hypothetical protein